MVYGVRMELQSHITGGNYQTWWIRWKERRGGRVAFKDVKCLGLMTTVSTAEAGPLEECCQVSCCCGSVMHVACGPRGWYKDDWSKLLTTV
jgi:hypothetical protein